MNARVAATSIGWLIGQLARPASVAASRIEDNASPARSRERRSSSTVARMASISSSVRQLVSCGWTRSPLQNGRAGKSPWLDRARGTFAAGTPLRAPIRSPLQSRRERGATTLDTAVLAEIRNHYRGALARGRDDNHRKRGALATEARTLIRRFRRFEDMILRF